MQAYFYALCVDILGRFFSKFEHKLNPNHTGVSESLIMRGGGGAKWPTGENWLYRPYFCILNIKNHIKGL